MPAVNVRCPAFAGHSHLRVVDHSIRGDVVRCAWRVPAHAAGRRLRGTVEVSYGGAIAERTFSLRIRP